MRIPRATYRIQLRPDFGFHQLCEQLEYLTLLGISDIYASPIFKARPGSTHGYDIIDPNALNPELGSETDWRELIDERRRRDLGWVQDIVPNHMAFSGDNPLMAALLEQGPRGDQASFFDIRWDHPDPELHGRVSAPFLADEADQCLKRGEISLIYDADGLAITYFDWRLPLALETYCAVFDKIAAWSAPHVQPAVTDWLHTLEGLRTDVAVDRRVMDDIKKRLWQRYLQSPDIHQYVERRLAAHNTGRPAKPLQLLLSRQHFHLTSRQKAARVINYRRFFSFNDLIGVRQEDRWIFDRTHSMIQRLVRSGIFTGLRVDHIDSLLAPGTYLRRLRRVCGDCYLIVEKIMADDEDLPLQWPVQGTSGYEFAAHVDRLFADRRNATAMTAVYEKFCGRRPDFDTTAKQCKSMILEQEFSGDLDNLTADFKALPEFGHFADDDLKAALTHVLISLPVYRTYLTDQLPRASDGRIITDAAADAGADAAADAATDAVGPRRPLSGCLDAIRTAMLDIGNGLAAKGATGLSSTPHGRTVGAFEQLSSALAAKGVEDTAFYRYNRLLALNDIGHSPRRFGQTREDFHAFAEKRCRRYPHALNALSTHDSKHSADVRARLLVLSEIPDEWAERVLTWREMNRPCWPPDPPAGLPDAEMEYVIYQTLVGSLPSTLADWAAYRRQIEAHILKAARENKTHTNRRTPAPDYEAGITAFVRGILSSDTQNHFLDDLRRFARRVAFFGRINALSQTLIQLTVPGVPDIYQGSELFDESLTDPDNRRPVNFQRRHRMLAELLQALDDRPDRLAAELVAAGEYDKAKLLLIHLGLRTRRHHPELFGQGDYRPLPAAGERAYHLVAFARHRNDQWCITVVPRFLTRPAAPGTDAGWWKCWADTRIELPADVPRQWRHVLTRASLRVERTELKAADLFADFPVALLMAEG